MHEGHHHHTNSSIVVLLIGTGMTLLFAFVEFISGYYANSLALISDAGHMAGDSLALGLGAFAAWIATKPATDTHTYGLGRAEVIGAWISSLSVLGIAIAVIIEAIYRLRSPESVNAVVVIWIGAAGILTNSLIALILSRSDRNLNVRAAILHVLSDLLGSIAAMITGVVIYYTHWSPIDPILSVFISILILISSISLIRESIVVLMEGVPGHIDISDVVRTLSEVPKVSKVHDLHIWTLSSGRIVLTAHIELESFSIWENLLPELKTLLAQKYDIHHITLQPETNYQTVHPSCNIPNPS
ncbi:MAG: cation diffusion facilitator family transporter [Gammaproteobacteria bacterium]|nr:cation diffusion facilitator family transporter [Gammaproteobacteria bacterium]